jgi:hypothetical protein
MGIRDKINAANAEQEQQAQAKAKPQSAPRTPDPFSTSNGAGPFDKLAGLATWTDILEPAGWESVTPGDADTLEAWRHPNATHPISGKILKSNPHVLVAWSTNCGLPDGPEQKNTKGRVYAWLWHYGDESAAAKAMLRGEATHLPAHLQEAVKAPPREPPDDGMPDSDPYQDQPEPDYAAVKERFPRLDWHALWADEAEQEWIHKPLLPARRLVAIYSAPKIGKSLLMLEMAVTLSRGEKFLGHTPDRRYRVLYVDYENDPLGDVRTRLQAMDYGPDDLDHLDYLSFPTFAALNSPRGAAELLAAVKAYGSEVVVIDTVSRAIDGEENSNDTWLNFYLHTGLQLKQLGVAMSRLDHSGKDESKGMRGGSAKAGDVDAFWLLTRITDTSLRLECNANRMELDTKLLKITRCSEPLRHQLEGAAAITTPEARVSQLIMLCDNDNLPADANRDAVREVAKRHGMKIAQSLIQQVVRHRKVNAPLPFTPSDNEPPNAEPTAPVNSVHPAEENPN